MYYIAGSFGNPEIVNVVSDQEVFDCPDLYSTQEEADTTERACAAGRTLHVIYEREEHSS
jgi:hypothetical protein